MSVKLLCRNQHAKAVPVKVHSAMSSPLEHGPAPSILHVAIGQERLLVKFGPDPIEATRWAESVKKLRAVWRQGGLMTSLGSHSLPYVEISIPQ